MPASKTQPEDMPDWNGSSADVFAEFPGIELWTQVHNNAYHSGTPAECERCRYFVARMGPMPPRWAIRQAHKEIWKRDNPEKAALELRRSQWEAKCSRIKPLLLERDGHKCRVCDSIKGLSVDHITPLVAGGTDDFDNLWILCRACNSRKRDRALPYQLSLFTTGKATVAKAAVPA